MLSKNKETNKQTGRQTKTIKHITSICEGAMYEVFFSEMTTTAHKKVISSTSWLNR